MVSTGVREMHCEMGCESSKARTTGTVRTAQSGGCAEAQGCCAGQTSAATGVARAFAEFGVPVRLVSLLNMREHWATKARRAKKQRNAARMCAMACNRFADIKSAIADGAQLVVTITRLAPRQLDDDNLAGSAKHVRDGIADALGIDDRDSRVRWRYGQAKGAPGRYSCAVRIEEAE